MCTSGPQPQRLLNDMDLSNWFTSDCLSDNLRTVIGRVILTPEPEVSPITYSSDSKCLLFEHFLHWYCTFYHIVLIQNNIFYQE